MSYVELGSTVFRGTLEAANGSAKFSLTASAIDAVDTININGGAVTYSVFSASGALTAVKDQTMYSTVINVPESALVEITVYSSRLKHVTVGGVNIGGTPTFFVGEHQLDTWLLINPNLDDIFHSTVYAENSQIRPFIALHALTPGNKTVALVADSSGSTTAEILVRYVRGTGQ